jgi:hypothetical protein
MERSEMRERQRSSGHRSWISLALHPGYGLPRTSCKTKPSQKAERFQRRQTNIRPPTSSAMAHSPVLPKRSHRDEL